MNAQKHIGVIKSIFFGLFAVVLMCVTGSASAYYYYYPRHPYVVVRWHHPYRWGYYHYRPYRYHYYYYHHRRW